MKSKKKITETFLKPIKSLEHNPKSLLYVDHECTLTTSGLENYLVGLGFHIHGLYDNNTFNIIEKIQTVKYDGIITEIHLNHEPYDYSKTGNNFRTGLLLIPDIRDGVYGTLNKFTPIAVYTGMPDHSYSQQLSAFDIPVVFQPHKYRLNPFLLKIANTKA